MKNQELVLDSYKKGAKSGGEFCTRLLEELSGVFWEELQKTLENGEFKNSLEIASYQAGFWTGFLNALIGYGIGMVMGFALVQGANTNKEEA
ncbi:MAG TPA: hypothetical protein ENF32_04925 [Thermosulfidibacter takaii]|uniref:Uncharacterized protein n=1 Tax=Thermosulfidibacter takaii TaxID=412593 RepID=A0A7C0U6K5_9BACT|nr:hypothetical protein [Thermosulfidibacter takaii]